MAREPIETLQALVSPATAQAPHKRSDLHWDHGCWGRILHFPHLKGNYTSIYIYVLIYIYIYIHIYIYIKSYIYIYEWVWIWSTKLFNIQKAQTHKNACGKAPGLLPSWTCCSMTSLIAPEILETRAPNGHFIGHMMITSGNCGGVTMLIYVTLNFQTNPYQMFHRSQETWSCRTRFFNTLQPHGYGSKLGTPILGWLMLN